MSAVPGFRHVPGLHCGSTALADVWRLHGADLGEAMAFGLGRGPHFFFLRTDGPRPTRATWGRSLSLEYDACLAVGASFEEEREPFGGASWQRLCANLAQGQTPIVSCDVGRLPYYGPGGAFNGHRLVLAGEDGTLALVADTHFVGLIALPVEALRHAMESDAPPVMSDESSWMLVGPPSRAVDEALLAEAVRDAGVRSLTDESGFGGLGGLRAFADDLPSWGTLPGAARLMRAAYHFIEKRGTGGGMFRRLYLSFLREAAAWCPRVEPVMARVEAAAEGWTELALELRAQSEREAISLDRAVGLARRVVALEEKWLLRAAAVEA